ncbi:uncharacterized protein C6orf118-like isoform X2 [Anguilla rostrata]|uniref:uncharacterized protein C6orf118-like isoform X2 n=1 Tax=Anguilla rostrata TaxID=7938 RepID=UPI0030CBA2C6
MRATGELTGRSDGRRELRALLLRVEEAHRADILTYCSGHLNPNRRPQKTPNGTVTAKEPKWTGSSAPEKGAVPRPPARIQPEVERRKNGLAIATVTAAAAPVTLDPPQSERGRKRPCHPLDPTRALLLRASRSGETGLAAGEPEDRSCLAVAESLIAGVTRGDRLQTRRRFERSVLETPDLREPKGLGRGKAAEKQEERLEQVLKELCAEPQLGRERLHLFSSVFGDVCSGSQVFGDILREIKPGPAPAGDLEEVREEVLRLEHDARKALVDNDQARMELKRERDQVQQMNGEQKQVDQQDPKQGEILVSPSDQVLQKRRQVRTVLEEVRLLESVIRKQMAPKDAVRATERCIRDLEAEIMALSTSNEHLCEANEELQRSISSLLDKEKITSEMQKEFWGRFGHPET